MMHWQLLPLSLLAVATPIFGAPCLNATKEPPRNWGVLLYDSFDLLDIAGPIEHLFLLSARTQLSLSLIAETLQPVWMRPESRAANPLSSHFALSVNPTHNFTHPPADMDVLLVPGGGGEELLDDGGSMSAAVDFVRRTYPRVRYLISVCTGAGVAARAGVLDGRRATTNKAAWAEITPLGSAVQWTSPARWVVDGNVWTASGVVSGIDLILAFIEKFYGRDLALEIQGLTEQRRTFDPCDDPFAAWHHVPPSGHCK